LLYHLVASAEEKQNGFAEVAEDAALRAALKSWKDRCYEPEVTANHDGATLSYAEKDHRKIVRNYIMHEVLVEAARSRLQNTREGNLLPMLLTHEAAVSTTFHPSAVVVLAACQDCRCDRSQSAGLACTSRESPCRA
jgi:hypothetical protein